MTSRFVFSRRQLFCLLYVFLLKMKTYQKLDAFNLQAISLENMVAGLNELLLWHGTTKEAAAAIASDGLPGATGFVESWMNSPLLKMGWLMLTLLISRIFGVQLRWFLCILVGCGMGMMPLLFLLNMVLTSQQMTWNVLSGSCWTTTPCTVGVSETGCT